MKKLYVQIIFALALAAGAASAKDHPRIQIKVLGTDTGARPFTVIPPISTARMRTLV